MSPIYHIKLYVAISHKRNETQSASQNSLLHSVLTAIIHSSTHPFIYPPVHLSIHSSRRADTLQSSTEDDKPAQKRRRSTLLLRSDSDSEEDGIESGELQCYRAEPSISIDYCPLQWWDAHSEAYGKLSALEHKYLASLATSVPSERLFSLAGHIVQNLINSLAPRKCDQASLSQQLMKKK